MSIAGKAILVAIFYVLYKKEFERLIK